MNCSGTLNTLGTSELPLQIRILELHVAVVRRIELPVLKLATAGEIHPVESAVKRRIGLDRREPAMKELKARWANPARF